MMRKRQSSKRQAKLARREVPAVKVLVIDVGGTNVKVFGSGQAGVRKFPSGPMLTPKQMVDGVLQLVGDWNYDVITIGYPGPVINGRLALEPRNLGPGWVDFDFAAHFGKPVQLINDAAMQALGSYEGGRMLFLGLGTGLGSALVFDGVVAPLEFAHLPYKKGRTFEDYVGLRGLKRLGKKKWQKAVEDVVARLQAALVADSVVLGGGNAKLLKRLPPGALMGDNRNAFRGGVRLWEGHDEHAGGA
jgi:polyphosphate glucokinase